MPSYIVVKRLTHDREYMPGEIMVDLPERQAGILAQRGFIQEVGDDVGQRHADAVAAAEGKSKETASEADFVRQGYSERAAKHLAKGGPDSDLPKYVQEEKKTIEERQARLEARTQAEIDRLATVTSISADDLLALSDEDYAAVLEEHPSEVPSAAADPDEVGSKTALEVDGRPFEALSAMPRDGLEKVMESVGLEVPETNGWFKDEEAKRSMIVAILQRAGYSGEALSPVPPPDEEPAQ